MLHIYYGLLKPAYLDPLSQVLLENVQENIPGTDILFKASYLVLDSSVSKESACNAGNPDSIPGLGRSAGEGISYPHQYSWASLVAQLVKNPPAIWETWVRSLGWEDPLEKRKATHSSILAWRIPRTVQSMGSQSQTRLSDFHHYYYHLVLISI